MRWNEPIAVAPFCAEYRDRTSMDGVLTFVIGETGKKFRLRNVSNSFVSSLSREFGGS